MREYMSNKSPKDKKLCQLLLKTINVNRKALGFSFEDVAHELGLDAGTLTNKLKVSYTTGDITLTEFIHLLELTGDYAALEYIAREFNLTIIKHEDVQPTCKDLNTSVDNLSMENADVFKAVKEAFADGQLDPDEKEKIQTEIDQVVKAALELQNQLKEM